MKITDAQKGVRLDSVTVSLHSGWPGGMEKKVIAAAAAFLFLYVAPFAFPIPIQIDLGPSGVNFGVQQVSFPAPDVQFQGQSIALDFTFQNAEFIRLFTQTTSFDIDLFLRINNAPSPQAFVGTEYLTDKLGAALGPPVNVSAFPVTNGANQVVGTDFFAIPLITTVAPVDIYGIHLDLTLPDSLGFGFGNGTFGAITLDGNIFGVGPNVPANVIPDTGGTGGLLVIALTTLVATQWISRCYRGHFTASESSQS